MTKSRAKLVNASSLAEHARKLDLGAHLALSRGEENSGGRNRASALTDAFEALLGAILLDGGFEAAREFILREFADDFDSLEEISGNLVADFDAGHTGADFDNFTGTIR